MLLDKLVQGYPHLVQLGIKLEKYLHPDCPTTSSTNALRIKVGQDGNSLINKGVNGELDRLVQLVHDQQAWLEEVSFSSLFYLNKRKGDLTYIYI